MPESLQWRGHWRTLAVLLWGALLVGSFGRSLLQPTPVGIGIYRIYAEAGRHWLGGRPVYADADGWDVFPYSPLTAVPFVPLSLLPDGWGSAVWKLLVALIYVLALDRWCRLALPRDLGPEGRAQLGLLVLPLAASTFVAGQMGAVVAAAILLGLTAIVERRWTLASAWLVLSCLLKVYPLSVALLLALCYPRRLLPRLVLVGLLALLLPFLFQSPAYVLDQYRGWSHLLAGSDRHDWPVTMANRNLALLFRIWLTPLPREVWLASQLLAALLAAFLCLSQRLRGWSLERVLLAALGLSGCWMTLFGPVVESYTYILVGPSLAWMLGQAWAEERPWLYRGVLLLAWSIFAFSAIAIWFPNTSRLHNLGPHPLAGCLLLACLLWDLARNLRRPGVSFPKQLSSGGWQRAA